MKILKSLNNLKEEDHRRALYATLIFIMLMILFFLLISLEEPDPPLTEPIVEIDLPDVEIIDVGSEDAGSSSETNANSTQESPPDIDTQDESPVNLPTGNGESDVPKPDESLGFPGGGNGGGTGTDFGDGGGVGGTGTGNSPGDGPSNLNRKVVKHPVFNAQTQDEGVIALDIWVDANGKVVKTRFKESKSTSGSAYLIKLAEKAARTMRYDTKPGAGWEHVQCRKSR